MDPYSSLGRTGVAEDLSRTSSVYSYYSENSRADQEPTNGIRTAPRAVSHKYTPSFMSHHATASVDRITTPSDLPNTTPASNGHTLSRKPVQAQLSAPPISSQDKAIDRPSATVTPGILIVIVAGALHPSIIFYLQMLLERQTFSSIVLAAPSTQEVGLKQLKIDVYSLIGRMGIELGVAVHIRDGWDQSAVHGLVNEVKKAGSGIQGVLCCPEMDQGGTVNTDILNLSEEELQQSWQQTIAFVHATMRGTVQDLLSRCQSDRASNTQGASFTSGGPFFLVAASTPFTTASRITKSGCDTLIHQLHTATQGNGLTVSYAETVLIPTPKPKELYPNKLTLLPPDHLSGTQPNHGFTPSESPTELWNMWALRNDIGDVDG